MKNNENFSLRRLLRQHPEDESVSQDLVRGEPRHVAAAFLSDQAVCSAGNFLTSFLAARTLPADQFGVFALLNIIIILSLTVNNWLIRSSLTKTSQAGDSVALTKYTSTLSGVAAIGAVVPATVLICAASALHHPELSAALLLAAVATQIQETMRRSAMAQSRFKIALAGDILSYLGQALILATAVLSHFLSVGLMFWTIGGTSLAAAAIMARGLKLQRPTSVLDAARACWEQGRWITLSGLILSPLVYGLPWIIEFTRGQAEAGILSGLILVLGLCNPIVFSSTWLILVTGQTVRNKPVSSLLRRIAPNFLLVSTPLVLFWMVVALFPAWILALFYSKRPLYLEMTGSLQLVVGLYAISYLAVCLEVITDTREQSRSRVWIDIVASTLMLSAGLLFSLKAGLVGLLSVAILAHAFRVVAYSLVLTKNGVDVPKGLPASATGSEEVSS